MTTPQSTSSKPSGQVEREVRPYEPTWLDKRFKKAFKSLSAKQQESCKEQLAALIAALKRCAHPLLDPELKRWRPGAYHVGGVGKDWQLVEYRLKGTLRVIGAFLPEEEKQPGQYSVLLLLTATLVHDHPRMKRLIAAHKDGWR